MKVYKSDLIQVDTDDSDEETTLNNNEMNDSAKPEPEPNPKPKSTLPVRVSQIITKPAIKKRTYKPRKKPTTYNKKKNYPQKQLQLPPPPPPLPPSSSPTSKSLPAAPPPPLSPPLLQVSASSPPPPGIEPTSVDPLQDALASLSASCERRVADLENELRLEEMRIIAEMKTAHQLRLTTYKKEIAAQLASACARMFPANQ